MSLGGALWAHVDWRTPDGLMWRWDPGLCMKHSLYPDTITLDQQLLDWYAGLERWPAGPPCDEGCPT